MKAMQASPAWSRRHRLRRTVAAAAAGAWLRADADPAALKVGLTPFLSTRALMGTYEPLRQHLASRLQRPVEFFTAPSFERLLDHARAIDQPFTMLPVHLALLAIEDWGFTLVARSRVESPLGLWQLAEAAAPWPADAASAAVLQGLRGRRIGVSDPLALAAMAVARWRDDQGLAASVEVRAHANLGGALLAARRGEVDFIGAPEAALRDALPPGAPAARRLLTLARLPSPAFVAGPAVAAAEVAAFRAALLDFSAAGASFGSAQYVAGVAAELAPWRPYAQRARLVLAQQAQQAQQASHPSR
jgi:phosphonate transport system substrate-binding protein